MGEGGRGDSCSESFYKTREVINEQTIHLLVNLHVEVCLIACLNKINVLIEKRFIRYFKENLGTHLKGTLIQNMLDTDAHAKIESCKLCIFNPYSFWVIYP